MSSLKLPKLYAIVDVDACARHERAPIDVTRAFLAAGASFLQLRAKTWESGRFLDLALEMTAAADRAAMVIVNDRADIAAIAEATGVHVGQTDLPPAHVRRLVGARAMVGLSTHSDAQLASAVAEPGPS